MLNRILLAVGVVVVGACIYSSVDEEPLARATVTVDPFVKRAAHLYEATEMYSDNPHAPEDNDVVKLTAYIADALRTWTKHSKQELAVIDEIDDTGMHAGVAHDIAMTVLNPDEAPLFGDTARDKTALQLATLAWFEGGMLLHVQNGDCNNMKWRKTKEGREFSVSFPCDGGYAVGLGQVHPEGGITLTPDGEWKHGFGDITAEKMIADQQLSWRVVLHMVRKSYRLTHGMTGYTGESGFAPKAQERVNFPRSWSKSHSFDIMQ